jgi:hypothetical protein
MRPSAMRFDHLFIVFGIVSGAALALLGPVLPPSLRAIPALMWLLGAILVFDLASAHIRGIAVQQSVTMVTRAIAFCAGVLVLVFSGQLWN